MGKGRPQLPRIQPVGRAVASTAWVSNFGPWRSLPLQQIHAAAQARGDFRIADRTLEAAFWRYYRDDSIHSFYRSGSREEAQAFAVAPWASAGTGGGPR